VLDALARGDRDGDGFISVNEPTGYVPGLVEDITGKTWSRRQVPRALFSGGNFKLPRQVPHMAPKLPDGRIIIPTKTTHVTSLEQLEVLKDVGGKGGVAHKLPRGAPVTHVETKDDWMLIAGDGKVPGYVPKSYDADDKLLELKRGDVHALARLLLPGRVGEHACSIERREQLCVSFRQLGPLRVIIHRSAPASERGM